MSQSFRHQLFVVAIAIVVFLANLGGPTLFDKDEPKNAACGQEMFQRGEWIVPLFNGELRTDKPILLYWCMLASYQVFGVSEFSARLPSALFAIGTTLLVYGLGRRLFSASVGIWAALILSTSLMFDVVARAATPDSTFIFCTTFILWVFVYATARRNGSGWGDRQAFDCAASRSRRIAALVAWPYRYWVALYAAMGLATLAKGPAGIVLPGAVMGLYLLVASAERASDRSPSRPASWSHRVYRRLSHAAQVCSPRAVAVTVWQLRPLTALAVVGTIALPWYAAVGMQTSGDWLLGFFGHHNLGRLTQPLEGHSGPFFYYLVAIAIGFFPWSIFLTLMGLHVAKQVRQDRDRRAMLLVICWVLADVGFFSLAQTKLPNYVLPAYPALALGAASLVHHWVVHPESMSRWLARSALILVPAVGVGLVVALPLVAHYLLPGETVLAVVGLALLVGGIATFWLAGTQRTSLAARCLGLTAIVFSVPFFWLRRRSRKSTHDKSAHGRSDRGARRQRLTAGNLQIFRTQPRILPCGADRALLSQRRDRRLVGGLCQHLLTGTGSKAR